MKTNAHAVSKGSDASRGEAQQHTGAARTARSLQPPRYGIGLVDESAPGEAAPLSIQRKAVTAEVGGPRPLPASGAGAAIPEDVRARMEGALGMDFSAVRVHEGPQAAAMGALAYTQGTDIYFAPGQYQPGSRHGQELLGHELAHVTQQAQGRVQATRQIHGRGVNDDVGLEREADTRGQQAAGAVMPAARGAAAPGAARPAGAHASATVMQLQLDPALRRRLNQEIAGAAAAGPRPPIQDPRGGVPGWAQERYRHLAAIGVAARARPQQPIPNQRGGVPGWAQVDYNMDAEELLVASVSEDKIGSVYFGDGSRIRTTHARGPAKEDHAGRTALRFNVRMNQATLEWMKTKEYDRELKSWSKKTLREWARERIDASGSALPAWVKDVVHGEDGEATSYKIDWSSAKREWLKSADYEGDFDYWFSKSFNLWLDRRLTRGTLPTWATRVAGYQDALNRTTTAPRQDEALYEVFLDKKGRIIAHHPSRGVAEQFRTDKQAISLLKAAVKEAEKVDPMDYDLRNEVFYKFVKRSNQALANKIRRPDEV